MKAVGDPVFLACCAWGLSFHHMSGYWVGKKDPDLSATCARNQASSKGIWGKIRNAGGLSFMGRYCSLQLEAGENKPYVLVWVCPGQSSIILRWAREKGKGSRSWLKCYRPSLFSWKDLDFLESMFPHLLYALSALPE